MLDQNTDRMWFVIGAVIVGAAIIFIANGTLPTLFASVSDSFETASEESLAVVDGIYPMRLPGSLIDMSQTQRGKWVAVDDDGDRPYDVTPGEVETVGGGQSHTLTGYMMVVPNTSYTFASEDKLGNRRVAFYDKDKKYISGEIQYGFTDAMTVVTPANALYAMASSEHIVRDMNRDSQISTWWFGKTIDYNGGE